MSGKLSTDQLQRHALYYVSPDKSGQLVMADGQVLDLLKYSRFKHGSGKDARDYGVDLGKSLLEAYPELFSGRFEIAVAAAPYRTVPKGAQGIADALLRYLNKEVLTSTLPKAVKVKITAENPASDTDYSSLTQSERDARNSHVMFHINPQDFVNKFLIVVDDSRITGGTESKILRLLDQLDNPPQVMMVYVACLDAEKAKEDPTIEDRMNTAYVKTLVQQSEIIAAGNFLLNPRVIQFVLNPKNIHDLRSFAELIDLNVLRIILKGIVTDVYHTKANYIPSFKILEEVFADRISEYKQEETNGKS